MARFWIFGLVAVVSFGISIGQECSSSDLTDDNFQWGVINTDLINVRHTDVIKEYPMANTLSIQVTTSNPTTKYIDARYDAINKKLQIYATQQLALYESRETSRRIALTIVLRCTVGTRLLIFEQPFDESNNHDPAFLEDHYEFMVTLPLPRGFDLTFFQEIAARDLDIRNNRVLFTSDNAMGISVGASGRNGTDGKTFYAALVTSRQMLSIDGQLEFDITATDVGKPPRSSKVHVTIKPDVRDVFVPVPQFTSAFYRGALNDKRELVIASPTITGNTYHPAIAFAFSGGDNDLFSMNRDANRITLHFARQLTDADVVGKSILMTTLVAQRADVDNGTAVIIVDIQPVSGEQPPTELWPTTDPLVVVCAVLGVLLLVTTFGCFLMWWYKIRPYNNLV